MIKLTLPFEDLKNATVIVPSVSVGNVPQLTADLIIQNTNCVKIGIGWHQGFEPYAGPNPYEVNGEMFSCIEAYYSKEKHLVVFQIRSSFTNDDDQKDFVEQFVAFLKKLDCWSSGKLLILTSIYMEARIDEEITDRSKFSAFRYIESTEVKACRGYGLDKLGWSQFNTNRFNEMQDEDDLWGCKNWGPGFGYDLFKECEKTLPAVMLLNFASDGYNNFDAEKYVEFINSMLAIIPEGQKLTYPLSWQGMTGDDVPTEF